MSKPDDLPVTTITVEGWVALFESSMPNSKGERECMPGSKIWSTLDEAKEARPHAIGYAKLSGSAEVPRAN